MCQKYATDYSKYKSVDNIFSANYPLSSENFHQLYYKDSKADGVSSLPIPAATQVTSHGVCEWQTLLLAPPPPMYRPFAILEEEKGEKKTRIQKMREKIGEMFIWVETAHLYPS